MTPSCRSGQRRVGRAQPLHRAHVADLVRQRHQLVVVQAEAVDAREAPQLGRHHGQAVAVRVQAVQAGQQADLRRQRGQLAVCDVPAAAGLLGLVRVLAKETLHPNYPKKMEYSDCGQPAQGAAGVRPAGSP